MVYLFAGSLGASLRHLGDGVDVSRTKSGSRAGRTYVDVASATGASLSSTYLSDARSFVGLNWWDVDDSHTVSVDGSLTPLAAQVSEASGVGQLLNASGTQFSSS